MNDIKEAWFAAALMVLLALLLVSPLSTGTQETSSRFTTFSFQAEARLSTALGASPALAETAPLVDPFDKDYVRQLLGPLEDKSRAEAETVFLALAGLAGKQELVASMLRQAPKKRAAEDPLAFLWNKALQPPEKARYVAELDLLPLSSWARTWLLAGYAERTKDKVEAGRLLEVKRADEAALLGGLGLLSVVYLLIFLVGGLLLGRLIRAYAANRLRLVDPGTGYVLRGTAVEAVSVFSFWLFLAFTVSALLAGLFRGVTDQGARILTVYCVQGAIGAWLVLRFGATGFSRRPGHSDLEPGAIVRSLGMGLDDLTPGAVFAGFKGFLMAVPVVFVLSVLSQLLLGAEANGGNPLIPFFIQDASTSSRTMLLLNVLIAAPLFEEFMFRGFLLRRFQRAIGTIGAVCLTSLLFASLHMSLEALLPLTGLGVMLAVTTLVTGNLWAAIVLHLLWNGSTILGVVLIYQ